MRVKNTRIAAVVLSALLSAGSLGTNVVSVAAANYDSYTTIGSVASGINVQGSQMTFRNKWGNDTKKGNNLGLKGQYNWNKREYDYTEYIYDLGSDISTDDIEEIVMNLGYGSSKSNFFIKLYGDNPFNVQGDSHDIYEEDMKWSGNTLTFSPRYSGNLRYIGIISNDSSYRGINLNIDNLVVKVKENTNLSYDADRMFFAHRWEDDAKNFAAPYDGSNYWNLKKTNGKYAASNELQFTRDTQEYFFELPDSLMVSKIKGIKVYTESDSKLSFAYKIYDPSMEEALVNFNALDGGNVEVKNSNAEAKYFAIMANDNGQFNGTRTLKVNKVEIEYAGASEAKASYAKPDLDAINANAQEMSPAEVRNENGVQYYHLDNSHYVADMGRSFDDIKLYGFKYRTNNLMRVELREGSYTGDPIANIKLSNTNGEFAEKYYTFNDPVTGTKDIYLVPVGGEADIYDVKTFKTPAKNIVAYDKDYPVSAKKGIPNNNLAVETEDGFELGTVGILKFSNVDFKGSSVISIKYRTSGAALLGITLDSPHGTEIITEKETNHVRLDSTNGQFVTRTFKISDINGLKDLYFTNYAGKIEIASFNVFKNVNDNASEVAKFTASGNGFSGDEKFELVYSATGPVIFHFSDENGKAISSVRGSKTEGSVQNTLEVSLDGIAGKKEIHVTVDGPQGGTATVSSFKVVGGTTEPEPTPVVTPEPTPVVTPEPTPVVTPEPTPVVTPVVTPEPTPVVTPEPTPVVTPEPTPVVTPEPTPVVTPEPTPVVTPVVTPEPTPVVTPVVTPEPTKEETVVKPEPTKPAVTNDVPAKDDSSDAAVTQPANNKKANTLSVKAKKLNVKGNKKASFKLNKFLTVKKAKGKVTYKKIDGDKKFSIDKKTGTLKIKKGLKTGKTYKITLEVTASGNSTYDAVTKKVTVKIKIK